jgi:biotin operon repressor
VSAFLDAHNFLAAKLAWQLAIIADTRLTDTARLVGCQLMHDLHSDRRHAWRSQESLAQLLGKDKRTIQRALAALSACGHLEVTVSRGRGHANEYRALAQSEKAALVSRDAWEKAAEVSRDGAEKAAPVSRDVGEKATPVSHKGGAGAAPYLEPSIKYPLTPEAGQQRSAEQRGSARGELVSIPDDLRTAVATDPRYGETWVRSWLDHCGYDPSTKTIHARTGLARGRIGEAIGGLIRSMGMQLGEPTARRLAA